MKKRILPLICACLIFAVIIVVLEMNNPESDMILPSMGSREGTEPSANAPQQFSLTETGSGQEESAKRIINEVEVTADLAVGYFDFESIIADAESIVAGTITKLDPVLNEQGRVYTVATVSVTSAIKGDAGETVDVYIDGGQISAREFYEFHAEMLKIKLSEEEFKRLYENIKDNDVVESTFMNVENVKVGDRLLFFLTFDKEIGFFRVTGTSDNGKFSFDETTGNYVRSNKDSETLQISLGELEETATKTPDNSVNLRTQLENMVPLEKDPAIVERNPAFDKYKGG